MKPFGKVPPGRREAALATVEDEIRGERARALGRTIRALEDALAAIPGVPPASRAGRAAREELVSDAAERLWFAVVQREALGLHRHDQFLRELRVPEEVARRMGPRRRGP